MRNTKVPELPEVQTIVDDLKKKVIGLKIVHVWLDWGKHLKNITPSRFRNNIKNALILDITRRAKNILISLDKNRLLVIHLKMTGNLLITRDAKIKNQKHVHMVFYLTKGNVMAFSDTRKFGKVLFGNTKDVLKLADLKEIGPEPLDPAFSFKDFENIITKRKRKIKPVLMDQKVLAGIGNIYADEILWSAKIYPGRFAHKLTKQELNEMYKSTRFILRKAIRFRGTSISDFKDTAGRPGRYANKLMVYGRIGLPCKRCDAPIKRIKLNGRSTHYCPNCQKN